MKYIIAIMSAISLSFPVNAQLLDKILAVIDSNIFSLSQVERVQKTLQPRKLIVPMIYEKEAYSQREIIELFLQRIMIRIKLEELGYIITDDQVEAQIKATEKRLGLTRESLNQFLRSNNLTFDEYFELTRESIEYNIFMDRIIAPLISVTEQEIKNEFYKENAEKNKRLEFKYTLVDFSIPKKSLSKDKASQLVELLENYRVNGILPQEFSGNLSTNTFSDITEEGLRNDLKNLLKTTDEGSFSKPITIDEDVHVFFVKKKDLVESQLFIQEKARIEQKLQKQALERMTDVWFERSKNKHYIKYFTK